MHLELTNEQELQSWLVTALEPMSASPQCRVTRLRSDPEHCVLRCDADPNTLAEYIIAVLKNEISDISDIDALHSFIEEQLKEFIQGWYSHSTSL